MPDGPVTHRFCYEPANMTNGGGDGTHVLGDGCGEPAWHSQVRLSREDASPSIDKFSHWDHCEFARCLLAGDSPTEHKHA